MENLYLIHHPDGSEEVVVVPDEALGCKLFEDYIPDDAVWYAALDKVWRFPGGEPDSPLSTEALLELMAAWEEDGSPKIIRKGTSPANLSNSTLDVSPCFVAVYIVEEPINRQKIAFSLPYETLKPNGVAEFEAELAKCCRWFACVESLGFKWNRELGTVVPTAGVLTLVHRLRSLSRRLGLCVAGKSCWSDRSVAKARLPKVMGKLTPKQEEADDDAEFPKK